MATEKQKKLKEIIMENYGAGIGKSMYQMMIEAGYSKNSAKNCKLILEGNDMKKELEPVVNQLKKARRKAIKKLNNTIDKAKYRDLVDGVDKLTKNIQLLGDKPTENIKVIEGFNYIKPNEKDNPNNSSSSETTSSVEKII